MVGGRVEEAVVAVVVLGGEDEGCEPAGWRLVSWLCIVGLSWMVGKCIQVREDNVNQEDIFAESIRHERRDEGREEEDDGHCRLQISSC